MGISLILRNEQGVGKYFDFTWLITCCMTMGVNIESEHTTNPRIQREIASDHLKEDPEYYTKLKEMEEGN